VVVVVIVALVADSIDKGVQNQGDVPLYIGPTITQNLLDYGYLYTPTPTPLSLTEIVPGPSATNCPKAEKCSWTQTPTPTETRRPEGPLLPPSSTPTKAPTKTPKNATATASVNYWDLLNETNTPPKTPSKSPIKKQINNWYMRYDKK
jgi:hypothetical protein